MCQPLFRSQIIYSTQKADKLPRESSYYLIDPVLELTATGRRSYLIDELPKESILQV
jgi:hypothetical protein